MATHVCFGDQADGTVDALQRYARLGQGTHWTVTHRARPGDGVVFYIKAPVGSFVATGAVRSIPKPEPPGSRWEGHHMALIRGDRMLAFRHRHAVAEAVPEWGWLRAPRREVTVPAEHEGAFLAALGAPLSMDLPIGQVQENVVRETRRLTRSRNRGLRDRVVLESGGVCAACRTDYARLVPGRWPSVLAGHHLNPLAASGDQPRLTDSSELAAVCPTCHVLLHLDPARPMTPEQLCAQLAAGAIVGPDVGSSPVDADLRRSEGTVVSSRRSWSAGSQVEN